MKMVCWKAFDFLALLLLVTHMHIFVHACISRGTIARVLGISVARYVCSKTTHKVPNNSDNSHVVQNSFHFYGGQLLAVHKIVINRLRVTVVTDSLWLVLVTRNQTRLFPAIALCNRFVWVRLLPVLPSQSPPLVKVRPPCLVRAQRPPLP